MDRGIMPKALITGITGQDGHHLTKFLLEKGYRIFGLVNGQRNFNEISFVEKFPEVQLIRGDLADFSSLISVMKLSQPDEVYNLGAISFVGMSFQQPELTANITGLGTLRLLEAVRSCNLEENVKFYQASSSEMFGKVLETPQTEKTPFYPRSPYGVAKTFAHYSCVNYREAYDMHVSSGILFNHEGEYRGYEFVTRKITSNLAKIKLGKIKKFSLGSLDPKRDWGYAGDFVEAMWLMTQHKTADTFVISTGVTHSVREFIQIALQKVGLDDDIEKYIDFDKNMIRPSEVDLLVGDSTKAFAELGWKPKTDLNKLIEIMIENDLRIESSRN
jgi:GDPmannose 4,6-dehydratase